MPLCLQVSFEGAIFLLTITNPIYEILEPSAGLSLVDDIVDKVFFISCIVNQGLRFEKLASQKK